MWRSSGEVSRGCILCCRWSGCGSALGGVPWLRLGCGGMEVEARVFRRGSELACARPGWGGGDIPGEDVCMLSYSCSRGCLEGRWCFEDLFVLPCPGPGRGNRNLVVVTAQGAPSFASSCIRELMICYSAYVMLLS